VITDLAAGPVALDRLYPSTPTALPFDRVARGSG
jgi:hypothetical protein